MQRFFFDDEVVTDGSFSVSGEKYNHIVRVLRMKIGEQAVFCDGKGTDYVCRLSAVQGDKALFNVVSSEFNKTEPQLKITLYQCLPKGDKLDDAVKRCVQFGIYRVVPVLSERCVSRPDPKSAKKKIERLNKIARSSAMQSMRGVIPQVCDVVDYKTAINQMKGYASAFVCYEEEREKLISSFEIPGDEVAFLIGPEGGLSCAEISFAKENGIQSVSLGRRILRTEDAAQFVIPILLSQTNNL